jgi:hypothetical protein
MKFKLNYNVKTYKQFIEVAGNNYLLLNGIDKKITNNRLKRFKLKQSKSMFYYSSNNDLSTTAYNTRIFYVQQENKVKFLNKLLFILINISKNDKKSLLINSNSVFNNEFIIKKKLFKKFSVKRFNKFFGFKKIYVTGRRLNKVSKFIRNLGIKNKFKNKFYKTKNIKYVLWQRRLNKRRKLYL